ncbi:MAG: AAA family ATPase [Candidatus Obscuribacterales bacterium]|jgi:hypothetical protein
MNTIVDKIADAISTADGTTDIISETPRTRLDLVTPSEDDRAFLAFINSNLFGQPAAKEMLLRIHRAAKNPFRDRTRPIYKALMPGDSHTGKTETACVLADYYHGNPEAFIRINCANYKNKGDISRLLGTGPGWVGYQKPPTDEELEANKDKFDASALLSAQNLTASRKGSKTPYTIVLLDEFEKAGEEFEQFILAIYSAAKERMGNNQEVDFSDCIFLMPCNLGMSEIAQKQKGSIGFITAKVDTTTELDGIITRRYPIEVINRFDEVCVYGKLTREDVNNVLGLHIKKVQKRVDVAYGSSAFTIVVEESARKRLLELCLNERGDVADLKRVVPRRLTDPVSVAVETGVIGAGDELIVSCEDGKEICFDRAGNGAVQKLDGTKLPKEVEPTALQKEAAVPKRRVNLAAVKLVAEAAGLVQSKEERQAQLVLERALLVMEKGPDDLMAVRANNMLGLLLHKNKMFGEAVKYFAAAVDARTALEECDESLPFGIVYGNLALALSHDGRKQKALEFMSDGMTAIRLYRKSETNDGITHFVNTYLGIDARKGKELLAFSISLRD